MAWLGTSVVHVESALLSLRAWRNTNVHTPQAALLLRPLSVSCVHSSSACFPSTGPTPASTTVARHHLMTAQLAIGHMHLMRMTPMANTRKHHWKVLNARDAPRSLPQRFHVNGTISASMPPHHVPRSDGATTSKTTRLAVALSLQEQYGSMVGSCCITTSVVIETVLFQLSVKGKQNVKENRTFILRVGTAFYRKAQFFSRIFATLMSAFKAAWKFNLVVMQIKICVQGRHFLVNLMRCAVFMKNLQATVCLSRKTVHVM